MGKVKKECNCKKDVRKLIETVDDINKSSSKGYAKKRSFFGRIGMNIFKISIYFTLGLVTSIFLIPYMLFKTVNKKNISFKINPKYILSK